MDLGLIKEKGGPEAAPFILLGTGYLVLFVLLMQLLITPVFLVLLHLLDLGRGHVVHPLDPPIVILSAFHLLLDGVEG